MPAAGRRTAEGRGHATPVASSEEIAGYIEDMVGQMELMASSAGLKDLSDLLRQAGDEARRQLGE